MDLNKLDKYDEKSEFVEELRKRTFETEMKCHGCAQVIVQTFLDVFEENNTPVSLIGGLMALGLVFGRKDVNEGMEGILTGIRPMRKLVKYFEETYLSPNCREITGTDLANPEKATAYFEAGGLEKCANMMADVAAFVGDIVYEEKEKRYEKS